MTTASPSGAEPVLVRAFRFSVSLNPSGAESNRPSSVGAPALGDGGFQECSGLSVDMDVQDYFEGGRNDHVVRRVGRAKYTPLVLKRGMFHAPGGVANGAFWRWLQDSVSGVFPVRRYDGIVQVMSTDNVSVVATWSFTGALPARVVGPTLNAMTGEVALEELHLAHEGLRLGKAPT